MGDFLNTHNREGVITYSMLTTQVYCIRKHVQLSANGHESSPRINYLIVLNYIIYMSLQSPQKTIPEHRLYTLRCKSNDDRMDKNSLIYAAVTKLTKYQNIHTGSLITTYHYAKIT
jgi:hypothetical protein